MASPNYIAGGNIYPASIVTQAGQADETVIQATSSSIPLAGVTTDGSFYPAGLLGADSYAAHSGQSVKVFGVGEECLCQSSTTISVNQLIKADSVGFGTPVLASDSLGVFYVGRALESTTGPNILFRLLVDPGFTTKIG